MRRLWLRAPLPERMKAAAGGSDPPSSTWSLLALPTPCPRRLRQCHTLSCAPHAPCRPLACTCCLWMARCPRGSWQTPCVGGVLGGLACPPCLLAATQELCVPTAVAIFGQRPIAAAGMVIMIYYDVMCTGCGCPPLVWSSCRSVCCGCNRRWPAEAPCLGCCKSTTTSHGARRRRAAQRTAKRRCVHPLHPLPRISAAGVPPRLPCAPAARPCVGNTRVKAHSLLFFWHACTNALVAAARSPLVVSEALLEGAVV